MSVLVVCEVIAEMQDIAWYLYFRDGDLTETECPHFLNKGISGLNAYEQS